ncbi:hypothetical protein LGAA44_90056 [Leuconostoc gasicomitatum]|nr:hypothetical protein LGAA44_90056 [Leuconostoc gasicomitatum]
MSYTTKNRSLIYKTAGRHLVLPPGVYVLLAQYNLISIISLLKINCVEN